MTREKEIKRRLFEISTSNFNNSVVDSSSYFAGYIDGAKSPMASINVGTAIAKESRQKKEK